MDTHERVQAAAQFLLQSPPGEINDVLNDVRNIISDDDLLQDGVRPALAEYNLAQFMTADVPGCEHLSIISEAARVKSEDGEEAAEQDRFLDPRSKTTFKFDHLTLEASDPRSVEPDAESEPLRAALETQTLAYVLNHFHDGVASVFSTPGSSTRFILQVVANKYNPPNFWSGRWRSEYAIDLEQGKAQGKILINVHYYEQGNVQLATTHSVSLALPPSITSNPQPSSAAKIIALIEEEEGRYQQSLSDVYHDMGEKTFKSLRRALPMTRQKLDWDRVMGYKLGAELTASKGGFNDA